MHNPYTTCYACGRTIRERADDIALFHCSSPEPALFFHDDGPNGKCREIAHAMRRVRGSNDWALSYRAYTWCPREAEGLAA